MTLWFRTLLAQVSSAGGKVRKIEVRQYHREKHFDRSRETLLDLPVDSKGQLTSGLTDYRPLGLDQYLRSVELSVTKHAYENSV